VEISFTSLAIVAAVGFTAPLLLGLVPKLRLPSVVLEIVLGVVIGRSLLGWAKADEPVTIMALIGLSFLLGPSFLPAADGANSYEASRDQGDGESASDDLVLPPACGCGPVTTAGFFGTPRAL
jgi:hypothetical protein